MKNAWICSKCSNNSPCIYNPFDNISYDKHDPSGHIMNDDAQSISNILNSCKSYNITEFNKLMNKHKGHTPIVFNNIDGNASNFDAFVAEIGGKCFEYSCFLAR